MFSYISILSKVMYFLPVSKEQFFHISFLAWFEENNEGIFSPYVLFVLDLIYLYTFKWPKRMLIHMAIQQSFIKDMRKCCKMFLHGMFSDVVVWKTITQH